VEKQNALEKNEALQGWKNEALDKDESVREIEQNVIVSTRNRDTV